MFEQYTQLSNDEFMKYPIIQHLGKDNRWTISDKEKRPVDAKYLLETHEVRNARVYDHPYPLVKLEELNTDPNLYHTNRAYRAQAQNNHVIMLDVEPSASPEVKQFAIDFPAHFTELSRNGGVHLVIAVPDKAITPENEYLFTSTVIKSPDNTFELILNDHYITFTKRIIHDKPIADFKNNPEDFNKLVTFLDNIVKMDAKAKEERELKRRMAIDFDDSDLHLNLINKVIESKSFVDFMQKQSEKTPDNFHGDTSRYEGSIATACAGHVHRFATSLPNTLVLKDTFKDMTENDWIYAAYLMTQFIVPKRDKHDEYRDGMPWLLYNAQSGWTFIRAKDEQKKKDSK